MTTIPAPSSAKHLKRILTKIHTFFFQPASPRPLAALRIGLALTLLAQAFFVRHEILRLFAEGGLVQSALAQYLGHPAAPKISWLAPLFDGLGFSEDAPVVVVCWVYAGSLVFLGLGLFTRISSVVAWLLHWTLMSTGNTSNYGVDLYAQIFLYYLMFAPAGDAWSLDVLRTGGNASPSVASRFVLRIMQLHLCLAYLASGIEKASGSQWWDGELLWRAFMLPVYHQFDMTWLARWPAISMVAGWSTLVFELGYCIFIWPRQTRRFWVLSIASLHLGIVIFLGLGVFGVIMSILTLTIFGISAEPGTGLIAAAKVPKPMVERGTAFDDIIDIAGDSPHPVL